MEEVFEDNLEIHSVRKARRLYNREVIKLLRPNLVRAIGGNHQLNYIGMLQHNLLITLRGFKRHKTTFLINLIGLSTGLAAALLILLWVNDERSVDTFHEKNDRLYWAFTHFQLSNNKFTWDYTSGQLAGAMLEEFPEVEASLRISNFRHRPKGIISFEEENFEVNGLFSDPNIFDVLTYPVLIGDPKALEHKSAVAISEDLAIKAFGTTESAIGKTIQWENDFFNNEFVIQTVFKAPPANATHQFNILVNYQWLIDFDSWSNAWNGGYAQTFLVLKNGTNLTEFNQKVADYMDQRVDNDKFTLFLRPYAENYLYGQYDNGIQDGGRIESVRLFTFVAIFILMIACINFMNLSTAQASKKMKEVGVKKTIGADRRSLIFQFISESLLLSLLSLVVAILLVSLLIPQFNDLTSKSIVLDLEQYLPRMFLLVLITGLFAGSYPAFYLSKFRPIEVLKGRYANLKGENWVRKGLVVLQFTLSIVFITAVIIINQQISFTLNKDLGYQRENIITFERKGQFDTDPQPMLSELSKIPGVLSVGNMAGDFLWGFDSSGGYTWDPSTEDDQNHLFKSPKFGYNIIEMMGLEIVKGRSFSRELNDDHNKVILNESAVELMGLEDPIGFILKDGYYSDVAREIVGVVKDFQYGSMHQEIEPMVIRFRNLGANYMLKIQEGTELVTLKAVEEVYKAFHPKYNFDVTFLDDNYEALYSAETKVARLSNYMAGIAIIISCLGLFGLATFTAERRSKEIGIRKILGASHATIVRLLTGTFTKTVALSIVISVPVAYLVAQKWLENFAYTINLQWWVFAIAGISAMLIAWLTVGFQTIKASMVNPAECLRNE